jgi:hypothetical protein
MLRVLQKECNPALNMVQKGLRQVLQQGQPRARSDFNQIIVPCSGNL